MSFRALPVIALSRLKLSRSMARLRHLLEVANSQCLFRTRGWLRAVAGYDDSVDGLVRPMTWSRSSRFFGGTPRRRSQFRCLAECPYRQRKRTETHQQAVGNVRLSQGENKTGTKLPDAVDPEISRLWISDGSTKL
jgi:hypothetical protein